MNCWFCLRSDDKVVAYAYPEAPGKKIIAAHPDCAKVQGISGELVEMKA